MEFKLAVKTGVVFSGVVLAIIALMNIGVFVIETNYTAKAIAYTNVLLSMLILVQISILIMLIYIYEEGEMGGRKR
jgi:hypothetical protein